MGTGWHLIAKDPTCPWEQEGPVGRGPPVPGVEVHSPVSKDDLQLGPGTLRTRAGLCRRATWRLQGEGHRFLLVIVWPSLSPPYVPLLPG